MFGLASKCQASQHILYRRSLERPRYRIQSLDVAKIPMILFKSKGGGSCSSKKQVVYKPYVKPAFMDHDYKNMGLKRPMSPHLDIYAPTLPAMTSIGQRITGAITTFYALLLSGSALFLSNGVDSLVSMIQSLNLGRMSILVLKFLLGAPFAYHYFIGMRFVAFNAGKWLQMKEVYSTAQRAIILAGVLSVFFAMI